MSYSSTRSQYSANTSTTAARSSTLIRPRLSSGLDFRTASNLLRPRPSRGLPEPRQDLPAEGRQSLPLHRRRLREQQAQDEMDVRPVAQPREDLAQPGDDLVDVPLDLDVRVDVGADGDRVR